MDAKVRLAILNIGPMRYVELLIDSEPPFVIFHADTAAVSLCSQIVPVKRVTLGLLVKILHLLYVILVDLRSQYVIAKATTAF